MPNLKGDRAGKMKKSFKSLKHYVFPWRWEYLGIAAEGTVGSVQKWVSLGKLTPTLRYIYIVG